MANFYYLKWRFYYNFYKTDLKSKKNVHAMNVKIDGENTEHPHIFVVPKRNEIYALENSIQLKWDLENEFKWFFLQKYETRFQRIKINGNKHRLLGFYWMIPFYNYMAKIHLIRYQFI